MKHSRAIVVRESVAEQTRNNAAEVHFAAAHFRQKSAALVLIEIGPVSQQTPRYGTQEGGPLYQLFVLMSFILFDFVRDRKRGTIPINTRMAA